MIKWIAIDNMVKYSKICCKNIESFTSESSGPAVSDLVEAILEDSSCSVAMMTSIAFYFMSMRAQFGASWNAAEEVFLKVCTKSGVSPSAAWVSFFVFLFPLQY